MKSRIVSAEGWRKVVRFVDEDAGLDAIISVHDATLGPGCGGCRIFPYESFEAGLEDVKKLSRTMTFKNALGGIPFGGAKAVIFADPKSEKTPGLLRAFGRAVDSLGGLYYTAEDSGVTEADIRLIRTVTPYAAGFSHGGVGGNPSPLTARGVCRGIEAAARFRLGAQSLEGVRVCILGVGAVGMTLARLVHERGGALIVADINEAAVAEACERFGAMAAAPDEAVAAEADVFAPCALGGSINAQNLDRLKAKIVAGGANNQLATPDMDAVLMERSVLYAPDYVINAAGVISIGLEIAGTWSEKEMSARIDKIGGRLTQIFERAEKEDRPTGTIAEDMAKEIIARAKKAA